MAKSHKLFAAILALGILALLASAVTLVVNNVVRGKAASATAILPTKAQNFDLTQVLKEYIAAKGNIKPTSVLIKQLGRPYVSFTADSLSPSDDTLTGTLEVILPPVLPLYIKLSDGKTAAFDCAVTPCTIKPQYANEDITATVLVTGSGPNVEQEFPIALKDYSAGSNLGIHEFPVTIPLAGYSGAYPQDLYSADLSIALNLPSNMDQNGASIFDSGPHSLVHTVDGGTVANTYNVSVTPTPKSFQQLESNADDTFAIAFSRDWYNQFFVFTVACIPLLFAILFFHLLFIAYGRHGIGRSFEHFTEALVVSILSVLPLRVVLVPGEIGGLTRVDLLLGIGLVCIVAVAAGKYAREISTGGSSDPRTEHEAEVLLEHPTREDPPDPPYGSTAPA